LPVGFLSVFNTRLRVLCFFSPFFSAGGSSILPTTLAPASLGAFTLSINISGFSFVFLAAGFTSSFFG